MSEMLENFIVNI